VGAKEPPRTDRLRRTIRDLGRQSLEEGLRSAARIVTAEEIADHGNRRCAGVDHRSGVVEGDATDRDDRDPVRQPHRGTDELQTNSRVTSILAAGAEHRSDGHISNRLENRALDLRPAVCGQTDDRVRAQQPARCCRRKIVLTDMDASRSGNERDVSTVVDDDARAVGMREPYGCVCEIQKCR